MANRRAKGSGGKSTKADLTVSDGAAADAVTPKPAASTLRGSASKAKPRSTSGRKSAPAPAAISTIEPDLGADRSGKAPPAPRSKRTSASKPAAEPRAAAASTAKRVKREDAAAAKDEAGRDASVARVPRALNKQEVVVELEPDLIDILRVNDRLAGSDEDDAELARSIRDSGQQTPIIVRLSNKDRSRYELAAGGRRLKVASELGTTVKAVVRDLDANEMVLAQALENTARRKLSYIERAAFAAGLEARLFHRKVIIAALNIDETELARITRQVHYITLKIIKAIGAAPQIGRTRWAALAEAIKQDEERALKVAEAKIAEKGFSALSSDERFAAVLEAVRGRRPTQPVHRIMLGDGVALASIKRTKGACTLRIDERVSPGFADYLTGRLEELHAAFGQSSDRIGAGTVATPRAQGSKPRSNAGRKSRPAD